MATTKIYAPNEAFTGVVAGVSFQDGVGQLDDDKHPGARRYFTRQRFGIGAKPNAPTAVETAGDAPARSASKDDWAAYAVQQGATDDDAKASTKAELIERYGSGSIATRPLVAVDSRDVSEPIPFGTKLRDASVDPHPDDFLAPVNAGTADPHGPNVVSPEIHGSGPAGIKPGDVHVGDPDAQDAAESELAESVLIDGEEHPSQPAPDPETGVTDVDRGPLGLSDPGSVELGKAGAAPAKTSSKASWVAYAISRGGDADAVNGLSRAELIDAYGPTETDES
jgi:hypothetical protein